MLVSEIVAPRTSRIVEVPDPEAGIGEVLVDVVASGVCTSDIGPWRAGPGDGSPIRLGHEIVGRVVAGGPESRGWRPGDLVTGLGDGGFATRAVMRASEVLPVPAGVAPEHAIGEPIADLEEAIARTPAAPGVRVAVVGLGFMGLGLVQLAKHRAPSLLVGVDPSPAARERALALGADLVFDPDELPDEFRTGTDREHEARMDVVLEATGATSGLRTAGTLVRPFGTLGVVGYHHSGDAPMDMDLWYKAVTIVNGFCPERPRLMRAMADVLGLVASHRFSYAPLVTHRFGLEGVDDAYELMDARDAGFVKSVLLPNG
jgi:L-iditol 2-dehydrogenase